MTFLDWCIKAHADTNHMYDEYLPYEFHLRMTIQAAKDFVACHPSGVHFQLFLDACAGHDLDEDARKNYNDYLHALMECDFKWGKINATWISEIIFAVSNERGRNREERANAHYYEKIRTIPGAKFVKMCDKIANVRYSVMTKSSKLDMHKKEHAHFLSEMQLESVYQPMVDHLNELLNK